MPRKHRPKGYKGEEEIEPINLDAVRMGIRKTEIKRGVEYTVQTTVGQNAEEEKTWTCPFCNTAIAKGLSHSVAWDLVRGIETRRHFHNGCWKSFQGPLL